MNQIATQNLDSRSQTWHPYACRYLVAPNYLFCLLLFYFSFREGWRDDFEPKMYFAAMLLSES